MQVQVNETQRKEIESILTINHSDLASLFKAPGQELQEFNCIEYLINANVIERKYLEQPTQKPLLDRYIKAYEVLGQNEFVGIVKRCLFMSKQTKIKSLRGYTINALEKEISKKEV